MKNEVAFLLLRTSCATFLTEVQFVIDQFSEKKLIDNNERKTISDIKQFLIEKPISGVVAKSVLNGILRTNFIYFFWRYWSPLAQQLNALIKKPEFSDEALRNGDFETLRPNYEYTQKLMTENTILIEKTEHLEAKLNQVSQELVSAWDETATIKDQLMELQLEKHKLTEQHITQLKVIHSQKQEISRLHLEVSKFKTLIVTQLPHVKLPELNPNNDNDCKYNGLYSAGLFQKELHRKNHNIHYDSASPVIVEIEDKYKIK